MVRIRRAVDVDSERPTSTLATVIATENSDTTMTSIATVAPSTSLVKGPAARLSETTAIATGGDSASMIVPASSATASRVAVGTDCAIVTNTKPPTARGTQTLRPATCRLIGFSCGLISPHRR